MPLKLPVLDDRRYADLVEEALAIIPAYAPAWTNHNASDPGITLVELLAYVTEMLIFQVDQINDQSRKAFLRLINGPEGSHLDDCGQDVASERDYAERPLDEQIREAVKKVRRKDRAVTAQDFERLAEQVEGVQRAHCLPRRVLRREDTRAWSVERPGHISVVVVASEVRKETLIIQRVKEYLEPRRLLTTRVHVVAPRFLRLSVRATVVVKTGAYDSDAAKNAAEKTAGALKRFFNPRTWPLGRSVYLAEIYQLLENVESVDYVTDIEITGVSESGRLKRNSRGELIVVEVRPDELVEAHIEPEHISLQAPASTRGRP